MHRNGYENPKLAAIRLLKAQENAKPSPQPLNPELENLLRYKEELECKAANQKAKLS